MSRVFLSLSAWICIVIVESTVAAELPEYTAAESKKHIGETARVTGKVDCVDAHRRSHILTLGGCEPKMDFYVRVAHGVPGPDLNVTELKGVVITASGKIEKSEVDDRPFIDVTSTSQIVPHNLKRAQAEAATVQQSGEDSSEPSGSTSRPTSAEVIDIPAAQAAFGIKAGNIKVTFADGHAETITKNGNCMQPHVSANGDIGWIQCTGFDRKGYALNEKVIIRLSRGAIKEFKPDPKAPFIGAWTFVDGDSALVIQSRSFHGPASFIRYDLATGKVTNKKDGRDDSEPPPKWAQPLST
jgi:hypothetical protein